MENQEVMEKAENIIEENEKEGFFKKVGNKIQSGANKVKGFAQKHPVATFITGTVVGSAATIGTAVAVNKVMNRDRDDFVEDADILEGDDVGTETSDIDVNDVEI